MRVWENTVTSLYNLRFTHKLAYTELVNKWHLETNTNNFDKLWHYPTIFYIFLNFWKLSVELRHFTYGTSNSFRHSYDILQLFLKYLLKASYFRACNISLCCRDQKVKRKIREQQIGLYTYNDVAASRSINADCVEDRVRALTSKQDIFWAVQQWPHLVLICR